MQIDLLKGELLNRLTKMVATRKMLYRKRQGNGIQDITHVTRILYKQMVREKVLISSKDKESIFWSKWGSTDEDLMQINEC